MHVALRQVADARRGSTFAQELSTHRFRSSRRGTLFIESETFLESLSFNQSAIVSLVLLLSVGLFNDNQISIIISQILLV